MQFIRSFTAMPFCVTYNLGTMLTTTIEWMAKDKVDSVEVTAKVKETKQGR